jgi:hypothetical protein
MALITDPIQTQNFELIREQIAAILAIEIDNQGVLTYDPSLQQMKVFVEAINPEDKTDLPLVNVSYVDGAYGDLKVYDGSNKGVYQYNIDVYTNAKQTDDNRGDYLSAVLLQKILGICRTIIDHPAYKILLFPPGIIWRVKSNSIKIRDEGKNDALNSRMGRLTIEVHATEKTCITAGILLAESDTTVKVNNTNDGYYYSVT